MPARRSRCWWGAGRTRAHDEIEQVADLLGAGTAKALLGKDVLSDELPWVTGAIGLLGTRPSYEMMRDCDTLLTIGSSFPYTQFLPRSRAGPRGADRHRRQHDRHALSVRGQYRLGREKCSARAHSASATREDRSWREKIESDVARWWETMDKQAAVDAHPINPLRMFAEASTRLPDDAIVTADSGSAANWYARQLKFRPGGCADRCPGPRDDGGRGCPTESAPSSRIRTGP